MKNSRKKVVLFLIITIFLLVSLACGTSTSPKLVATSAPSEVAGSKEEPKKSPAPIIQEKFNVGDIVSIGDNVLVILGWENTPANDFSKPEEGKKFVAVELLLVNKSQSPISVSSMLQMNMKDDTSQKYAVDFMATTAINAGSVDGELAPGEKVRGKIGFQISDNAKGLQFVFDASIFGTGKVFVELGSEPVKVEPPAELASETVQPTNNVGDVIALGTTTLTVNEVLYPAGDQFNKPKAGNKFLVIDLTIENKGTTAISVSTLLQMWLKDSVSQKHAVDLMASVASGGTSPDGEIAPNEKLRGQVGFQIPENTTGLVFVFDGDVWGTGKAFIELP